MTVGAPGDPLPGPRVDETILSPDMMGMSAVEFEHLLHEVWLRTPPWPPTPAPNPILEEPAYFPGANWKHESGVPQYGYDPAPPTHSVLHTTQAVYV